MGPVSTVMGDHLRPSYYIVILTKLPRPTQPSTISGTGNKYQLQRGDAVWLGVKAGVAHSVCECTWEWQVKLCHPSLTRALPEGIMT